MIEIALISILVLAALGFAGLWVRSKRVAQRELAAGLAAHRTLWEAEERQKLHTRFNEEYLQALRDAEENGQ